MSRKAKPSIFDQNNPNQFILTNKLDWVLEKEHDKWYHLQQENFKIETVTAVISILKWGFSRGTLQIYLISPSGTKSQLLFERQKDFRRQGIKQWSFMSVAFWGEKAYGKWTLEIVQNNDIVTDSIARGQSRTGVLNMFELRFTGIDRYTGFRNQREFLMENLIGDEYREMASYFEEPQPISEVQVYTQKKKPTKEQKKCSRWNPFC